MADIPETTSEDDLSEVFDETVVLGEDDQALDQGQFADVAEDRKSVV